ncbi:MAG TPA: tetratricopeptide repeat protein [Bryobacteraceae bacterium]|nr:tetratricopeptide repeat protein [Bryobacteraceae bacterium]
MIHRTLAVIVLSGAAWLVYNYVANAPERARAELALGVKKLSPGAYEEAMAHFNRAIQIWPDYGEAYLNRAVAEHDESQPGPALADLNRALDLDPESTRAYNERGQIYLENGDLHKAIAEFSRSLEVTPTVEGHYQRGEAYEKLGDHQKAIADFDAAIVESGEAPYAFRARAAAKRANGDRAGAAADEEKASWLETGQAPHPDVLSAP